jgi:hypothetical protein
MQLTRAAAQAQSAKRSTRHKQDTEHHCVTGKSMRQPPTHLRVLLSAPSSGLVCSQASFSDFAACSVCTFAPLPAHAARRQQHQLAHAGRHTTHHLVFHTALALGAT